MSDQAAMYLISHDDLHRLLEWAGEHVEGHDGPIGDAEAIQYGQLMRRVRSGTGINDVAALRDEIRDALEGDSNDDEHGALESVASALGLRYTPFDDLED